MPYVATFEELESLEMQQEKSRDKHLDFFYLHILYEVISKNCAENIIKK